MRTALAFALLLAACGEPSDSPRDASTPPIDAPVTDSGPALLPWQLAGCEQVPVCIEVDGAARFCQSAHEYVAQDPQGISVGDCTRWLRCPATAVDDACFMCRDWSSSPRRIVEPEASPDQPECSVEFCPRPDAGELPDGALPPARRCGDAGV